MDILVEADGGPKRDAVLFAIEAHLLHGPRLSREGRQRAIRRLLADEEWGPDDRLAAPRSSPDLHAANCAAGLGVVWLRWAAAVSACLSAGLSGA